MVCLSGMEEMALRPWFTAGATADWYSAPTPASAAIAEAIE